MTPNFALNLSHEGIALLHRTGSGWMRVGEVKVDAPDLGRQLQMLRRTAAELEKGGIATALILPDSQILYTEIHAPGPGDAARETQIRAGLDGMTPYAVDELVFDWAGEGEVVKVAVVAKETLEEAETFAVEHRFNPVRFTAAPDPARFPGEPDFGPTRHAAKLNLAPSTEPVPSPARVTASKPAAAEPTHREAESDEPPIPAPSFAARHEHDRPAPRKEAPPRLAAAGRLSVGVAEPHLGAAPAKSADTAAAPPANTTGKAEPAGAPPAAPDTDAEGPPPGFSSRRKDGAGGAARLDRVQPRLDLVSPDAKKPQPAKRVRGKKGSKAASQTTRPSEPPSKAARSSPVPPSPPPEPVARAAVFSEPGRAKGAPAPPAAPATKVAEAPGKRSAPPRLAATLKTGLARIRPAAAPDPKEAEALTLFGQRGKSGGLERDTVRSLGIAATAALIAVLVLIAVLSLVFRSPEETAEPETPPLETPPVLSLADPEAGRAGTTGGVSAPDLDMSLTPPSPEEGPGRMAGAETSPQPVPAPQVPGASPSPGNDIAPASPAGPGPVTPAPGSAGFEIDTDRLPGGDGEETAPIEIARLDNALPEGTPRPGDLAPPATPEALPRVVQPMTRELAEAHYARTGVWPLDPEPGTSPRGEALDDLYIASIDPRIEMLDAYALPEQPPRRDDQRPSTPTPPPPPGTSFDLDERGLVRATPEGSVTPEGIIVRAGRPPVVPAPRPEDLAGPAQSRPDLERLRQLRPLPRPPDLIESNERSRLGGRSLIELAAVRPPLRPESPQDLAEEEDNTPTALAVVASLTPQMRPEDFERIVEEARASLVVSPPAPDVAPPDTPTGPTTASVAREATLEDAINLRRMNLIGVYGTPSNRRALVRLASGRLVKVQVGDSLDGGKVAAIDEDRLVYVKGGRTLTLKIPSG